MFHVYEFEVFEDEGWFLAVPFGFLGGTQGESYAEACRMAADWLRVECEYRAMREEPFPEATFGNEPRHGGAVMVVGVEADRDTVRKDRMAMRRPFCASRLTLYRAFGIFIHVRRASAERGWLSWTGLGTGSSAFWLKSQATT